MRSALAATALGITLTVAALASCANPGEPGETPGPEPSVTPVFASEEEALEAAGELYGKYVDFANALGQSGWADPSGFKSYVRGEALADELETAASFHDKGWVQLGATTFDNLSLQQFDDLGGGLVDIAVYLCSDVSQVDVVDATGISVVTDSRPARQPIEVEFDGKVGDLKIVRREAWSGASFC